MKRAALFLLLLAGCASAQTSSDYDPAVDFSRYRTYAWLDGTAAPSPLTEDRIKNAVDGQLAAKGLTKADASPDLRVATHAAGSVEKQIDVNSYGYGYGRGAWARGGTSTVNVRDIKVGTVMVDLVDAESGKLVWRGVASQTVGDTVSAEQVGKAMAKLFAGFPPAPK